MMLGPVLHWIGASTSPKFISFKRTGVLLSPVANAAGGISGGVMPTVGVTMPEIFIF